MEFDELLDAVPADNAGEADILTLDVDIDADGPAGPRLAAFALKGDLGNEVRDAARQVVHRLKRHLEDRGSEPVDWQPGDALDAGEIGFVAGGANEFHRKIGELKVRLSVDPLNGLLAAPPAERVRAIAFTVLATEDARGRDLASPERLTVIRRRDPMRQFGSARRRGVLASWLDGGLVRTSYVFAYDGDWDVLAFGSDFYVKDRLAYEELFGGGGRVQAVWQATEAILRTIIPNPTDLKKLSDHEYSRERLRAIRPDIATYLKSPTARDTFARLGFDEVFLDDGTLSFGATPAARAQVLRILSDGYLDSALTPDTYAVDAKQPWPTRRVVTHVRKSDGRVAALLGDGPWSPASVEQAAAEITGRTVRYSILHRGRHRPITLSRARAHRGELWVFSSGASEDGLARGENLLSMLEEVQPSAGNES